ncbi:MAG TPA: triple tyrosine motif-containing protein, partial [Nitrosopumilaceae archaeon]|nr:triple tyrosine motif-containing protein [Nitrosopumilaceae archaeon]
FVFSEVTGKVSSCIKDGNEFVALKCFTNDRKGNVWGGNYLFLAKIDPVKNVVVKKYIANSRIISLYCDDQDEIWLGCVNGLWSFKNDSFNYHGNENRVFKNRIEDISVYKDKIWWYATKGSGVIVRKGNSFLEIDKSKGLSSNICKNVFIEDSNTVWIGTNNGINRIRMKEWGNYSIDVYSSDEGLVSNEINQIVKAGNRIWAATSQGIVLFDAGKTFKNITPPPVYITSLEINSTTKKLRDTFYLRYFENYLKIGYTGLSYKRSSRLAYKFKLEGLDTSWHYTHNTSIQYTTLPPGSYTFLVIAVNIDGVESTSPARFSFVIHKPFWKEWWFIILVFCIVTTSIVIIVNRRIRFIQKRSIERAEINRKIADLELKALRAQMNPHFIF